MGGGRSFEDAESVVAAVGGDSLPGVAEQVPLGSFQMTNWRKCKTKYSAHQLHVYVCSTCKLQRMRDFHRLEQSCDNSAWTHCIADDLIEGCVDLGEGEGKEVSLRVEDKVIHVQQEVILVGKEKIQVFEGLCQDVGIHSREGDHKTDEQRDWQ